MEEQTRPEPANSISAETGGEQIHFARPVALSLSAPKPPAIHLAELPRRAAWFDLSAFIIFVLGVEALAGSLLTSFSPEDAATHSQRRQDLVVPGLVFRVVICLTAITLIQRARGLGGESLGLRWRALGWDVLLGLPTLAMAGCAVLAVMLIVWVVFPSAQKHAMENSRILSDLIPRMSIAGYFALMSMVGIYEEIVFRGFVLPRLRRGSGSWIVAVLLGSALFTIPHAADQEWVALLPVAMLSLTFSVVTIFRRSIVPAVVAHVLWNFGVIVYVHRIVMTAD